jgi:hypothetical protein
MRRLLDTTAVYTPEQSTWVCGTLAPIVLGLNAESRKIGLEIYKVIMTCGTLRKSKKYINPDVDLLVLDNMIWASRLPPAIRQTVGEMVQHLELRLLGSYDITSLQWPESAPTFATALSKMCDWVRPHGFKALKNLVLGISDVAEYHYRPGFKTLAEADSCRENVHGIFYGRATVPAAGQISVPEVFISDRMCSLFVERHEERYRKNERDISLANERHRERVQEIKRARLIEIRRLDRERRNCGASQPAADWNY